MTAALPTVQFAAANPASSVWVSASAGTGKTTILIKRILRLLLDGNPPEKLLCITYTKSAAAEILDRISKKAGEWATSDDTTLQKSLEDLLERPPHAHERTTSRTLLPKILQVSGGMRIMTIHAFCQSVLSRFPLESGINGNFQICDENQSHDLLTRAKQNLLLKTTETSNPDLFRALTFLYDRLVVEETQDRLINSVIKKRHKLEALNARFDSFAEYKAYLCDVLSVDPNATLSALDDDLLNGIPQNVDLHRDVLRNGKDTPEKMADRIQNYLDDPSAATYFKVFATEGGELRADILRGIDKTKTALCDYLTAEMQRMAAYAAKRSAVDLMLCSTSLYLCCSSLLGEYEVLKRKANLLDYEDQILLTEKLLTTLSDCAWVLYKLDAGIDHIMLDEAQDTSPSQWAIVQKLAEEFFNTSPENKELIRTVFVVGDEKQSIFSFQNADPASFSLMKETLKADAAVKSHPYDDLSLVENYRSSSLILDYVDVVFKDSALKNSISQIDKPIKHKAHHANYAGQIDVWPLVPVQEEKNTFDTGENKLAVQIAAHVKKLYDDKTIINKGRPLQYGDVMILVRKRQPMVNPLVKAFKDLGIPVRSVDRLPLNEQLSVQDCLTALETCLNPADDYNTACFLKSPFIGFNDDDVFKLAHKRPGTLWENVLADPACAHIVAYHDRFCQVTAENIPYHFFHSLLSLPCPADARSGKYALITRLGYDAEDVLDQFLDAVSSYQQNNTASNQGFITWLLQSDATTKAQGMNADSSHVRIITVHASKGLQAPVVFMADAHSKPGGYNSNMDVLWRDDDTFLWAMKPGSDQPIFEDMKVDYLRSTFDEYYRLLYVALTRAEERLIICGCAQKKNMHKNYKSWHDIASAAITQIDYKKEAFQLFGSDGVSAIKPPQGERKIAANDKKAKIYEIPPFLIDKPDAEPVPHFPLRPSQLPGRKQAVFSPLSSTQAQHFMRGEILHKLFYAASNYTKEEQPAILRRILDNYSDDTKQKDAYYDEVWSILSNLRFADLFSPKSRSEVPITGQIILDGTLYNVNGQIDRLLVEDDRVLIVDFKTNRPATMSQDAVSENYKFQLAAYKMILAKIYPDKKIETAILWTSVPYLLPLSL